MKRLLAYILPLKVKEYLVKNNVEKAYKANEQGNYHEALSLLDWQSKFTGFYNNTLLALGYSYIGLNLKSHTLEIIKTYKNNLKQDLSIKTLEASYYFTFDSKTKAIELLDEILTITPECTLTLNNKGFYLSQMEQYEESKQTLELLFQLDSNYVFGLNNLGFTEFKLGNIDKGLELINKSLELEWRNAYAHKNKAIILIELGNEKEALKHIKTALSMNYTKKYGPEVERLYYSLKHR